MGTSTFYTRYDLVILANSSGKLPNPGAFGLQKPHPKACSKLKSSQRLFWAFHLRDFRRRSKKGNGPGLPFTAILGGHGNGAVTMISLRKRTNYDSVLINSEINGEVKHEIVIKRTKRS